MASSQISFTFIFIFVLSSFASAFPFSVRNLTAVELPSLSFNSVTAAPDCTQHFAAADDHRRPANHLKLHLHHRPLSPKSDSVVGAAHKDLTHIHSLFRRIISDSAHPLLLDPGSLVKNHSPDLAGRVVATINSGVSLGSGEYFINAFVGTPPVHVPLILDTGSDLNWLQCLPCVDCFPQHGPVFDPAASSSFRPIPCSDPRCSLVTSPSSSPPCNHSSSPAPCPYFYWYGDRSNTTGDLALETFTVNLTTASPAPVSHEVNDVIFGCGHWNRGLFHGAAGLLGLGRGPLSFASQLRALYGHTFSYCLVSRNSDLSVTSKLVFGEDRTLSTHPNLNYTSFVAAAATDTFYYVQVKGIRVGGELLNIPPHTWDLNKDGAGGTIIDSGTTLSYFAEPAYQAIKDAFVKRVKYPVVHDFPVLSPCYNVTGVASVDMPGFGIEFADGAVWDFPTENYFIRLEPEDIMCLAILGTPSSSLSIVGNYQQQNFHMVYDTDKSRLGFAPMRCAQV